MRASRLKMLAIVVAVTCTVAAACATSTAGRRVSTDPALESGPVEKLPIDSRRW